LPSATNQEDDANNAFDSMGQGFFSNNNASREPSEGAAKTGGLGGALGFEEDTGEGGLMADVEHGAMDELAMMEEEGMMAS